MIELQVFTLKGRRFTVEHVHDDTTGPPWENGDGYGIVSEWTTRGKLPGERLLYSDWTRKRYYNVTATMRKAKKEQWGLPAEEAQGLTPKQILARAVEKDFQFHKRWCDDEWDYIGVVVTLKGTNYGARLWGIESDAGEYLNVVARELAAEILHELPAKINADIKRLEEIRDAT